MAAPAFHPLSPNILTADEDVCFLWYLAVEDIFLFFFGGKALAPSLQRPPDV